MEPLTSWSADIQPSYDQCKLYRKKKDITTHYTISSTLLGAGVARKVYELSPHPKSKSKAIQIGVHIETNRKEFYLIKKLNPNGLQTGIVRPPKYFCASPTFSIQIMSKYETDLFEMINNKKLSEQNIIDAIKQILYGLKILAENQIVHRDLKTSNILVGTWKGATRFDITDFESSIDISKANNLDDLENLGFSKVWHLGKIDPIFSPLKQFSDDERPIMMRQRMLNYNLLQFKKCILTFFLAVTQNPEIRKINDWLSFPSLYPDDSETVFLTAAPSIDEILTKFASSSAASFPKSREYR